MGPIRVLWVVSRFGRITALLLEGVIMLIAMFVLGPLGYLAIRCGPGTPDGDRDRPGGACDSAACRNRRSLWLRGLPLREYVASFENIPGTISLVLFLLFAAMPALVTMLRRAGGGTAP